MFPILSFVFCQIWGINFMNELMSNLKIVSVNQYLTLMFKIYVCAPLRIRHWSQNLLNLYLTDFTDKCLYQVSDMARHTGLAKSVAYCWSISAVFSSVVSDKLVDLCMVLLSGHSELNMIVVQRLYVEYLCFLTSNVSGQKRFLYHSTIIAETGY